mmetsp:Transcript_19558/g.14267  ORF Transcript_19558/g.14267 Transcript_19558/m.14267 type:complete len:156 (-) Transcript_19558:1017-1484(-)
MTATVVEESVSTVPSTSEQVASSTSSSTTTSASSSRTGSLEVSHNATGTVTTSQSSTTSVQNGGASVSSYSDYYRPTFSIQRESVSTQAVKQDSFQTIVDSLMGTEYKLFSNGSAYNDQGVLVSTGGETGLDAYMLAYSYETITNSYTGEIFYAY